MASDKKHMNIDLGDLEAPVAPLHPAFGGARVGADGALRVRTEIRAGSLAARGNIVQAYPTAPTDDVYVPPVILVGRGG